MIYEYKKYHCEGYNSMQGDTKVICRIMQCPDVPPVRLLSRCGLVHCVLQILPIASTTVYRFPSIYKKIYIYFNCFLPPYNMSPVRMLIQSCDGHGLFIAL